MIFNLFHELSVPVKLTNLPLSVVSMVNNFLIAAKTDHPVQHLQWSQCHPPPLRGRGLLLLQGLLQAGDWEALLLRGGHGRLQHRPDQQAELPVVQV